MVRLSVLSVASLMPLGASSFSVPTDATVSRREVFAKASALIGGTIAAGASVPSAWAVVTDETPRVTSRMGGLLVGLYLIN